MAAARRQQVLGWIVRCPAGLAKLAGRELRFRRVLRPDSRIVQRRQRGHDLLFLPRSSTARAPDCSLRIPEAVFECIAYGRYKLSKTQLASIAAAVRATDRPHRLLVAVDGSHFRRQDLTRWLAQNLESLGAPPSNEAADTLAMFCIDEAYYIGLQRCSFMDAPHRDRRTHEREGALPVTIAAAMSFAGRPRPGEAVLDPFCGSGTLLAEAAAYASPLTLTGLDTDPRALEAARDNLASLESVRLERRDARDTGVRAGSIDLFLSNLPFGKRFGDRRDNPDLYREVVREIARLGSGPEWRAVLVTSDDAALVAAASRAGTPLTVEIVATVAIRGETAQVLRLAPAPMG